MSLPHYITRGWSDGAANLNKQETISTNDPSEMKADIAVANGATALEIAFVLARANLKSMFWLSDQDITIVTNNSGSPVDTFNLKAGIPKIWTASDGSSNPFSADVTKLFAANASGAAATFQYRMLKDGTP